MTAHRSPAPGASRAAHAARWRPACGAVPGPDGTTTFRVWAPKARRVAVVFPEREGLAVPLAPRGDGPWAGRCEATVPELPAGSDYAFRLDGGQPLPDPWSRWQPHGVHGASRVLDPASFAWTDGAWRGLPLEHCVFYELHVGTFTPKGTFDAAIERLDWLRELGVTAVELMPVAQFPGGRNWGYDGVQLFAPQSTYGGPAGLQRLVDACHARGMALFLDVVYNHLGPEGNYLGAYGPYFSARYHTPWGDALNLDDSDCEPVRRFFIDNALHWLHDYHVDGLRLDAVHGIFDANATHLLAALAEAFHAAAARLGRPAWLIAESDLNDPRVIDPRALGGWGLDGQWNDDFHHAQHALLTGHSQGYFGDFGRVRDVAQALTQGYVLDGRWSPYRRRRHGASSAGRPGRRFVAFVQNHDQVANAEAGQRLGALVTPAQERLAATVLLCAPSVPMLFMGQEFGARTPFLYFTSHGDAALAKAVSEGRRRDHAAFQGDVAFHDPQSEAAFAASRLDWGCLARAPHAGILRCYRDLLALRAAHPALHDCDLTRARAGGHEARRWLLLERGALDGPEDSSVDGVNGSAGEAVLLAANYAAAPVRVPLPFAAPGSAVAAAQWRRVFWSGAAEYTDDNEAPSGEAPPETLAGVIDGGLPDGELTLGPWQAVLYLRGARATTEPR